MCLCDNKGAVAISGNAVLHNRSKHIDIKYHLVRIEVNKKHVRFKYVNTKDNLSDLLTKALPKVTHEFLSSKLLMRMDDDEVLNYRGEVDTEFALREPSDLVLYEVDPPGLAFDDLLIPGVQQRQQDGSEIARPDRELTSEEQIAEVEGSGEVAPERDIVGEACRATAKAVAALVVGSRHDDEETAIRSACCAAVRAVSKLVARAIDADEGCGRMEALMSVSRDLVASLMGAIVDSGASFTYVTNGVKLSEVRPGRGHVWVADGRRENIHETGALGPLTNVKKVRSFPRSLISVRDIVEKFGGVYFDGRGVHVVTLVDGVSIGDLTGGDGRPQRNF